MKNCFIKVAALLLVCCAMLGCGKESKLGSIYGTVTDFATGDPVSNANVRLNPRGETTLTGSDGTFQFNDVTDGRYSLSLSKNGYVDLDDDYVIEITNGNSVRRDVQLSPEYESIKITVNGVETDTLYFDGTYAHAIAAFLITNNGTVVVDVYGVASELLWLFNRYYPDNNSNGDYWTHSELQPNKGYTVTAVTKNITFNSGDTIGYIYINSSQISKTLICICR